MEGKGSNINILLSRDREMKTFHRDSDTQDFSQLGERKDTIISGMTSVLTYF